MMIDDIYIHERRRIWFVIAPFVMLAVTPALIAVPPIEPLPAPDYSFDLLSCAVDGGELGAGDVLNLAFPLPEVELCGFMLGLLYPEDDLDAFSGPNHDVGDANDFTLLFSVDLASTGLAPPDVELIRLHVPYNAYDQAARGHAAGDQFMSTLLFTRHGAPGGTIVNNVLTRNNYDEGGTDFSANPATTAYDQLFDDLYDVVDATGFLSRVEGLIVDVYFSLTTFSPSLLEMPFYDTPSGADIYVNENPPAYAPTMRYASYVDLNLSETDDIDALIVFDVNANLLYDGDDQVLFSLAPNSPSLTTIPDASTIAAAADIFTVSPGQAPALFASAAELGLGAPDDNVNALALHLTDDPVVAAARHGIRSPLGDVNHDGAVDMNDLAVLLAHYGATVGADYTQGDLDRDGDVDLSDLAALLSNYGFACN